MANSLRIFASVSVLTLAFDLAAVAQSLPEKTFELTYDPQAKLEIEKTSPANPDDVQQVRRGSVLYLDHCADCHGAALEGAENWNQPSEDGTFWPPAHDEPGHSWHHSDKVLFEYVKLSGSELFKDYPDVVSNMPGFGDVLEDEEIWAIYVFIKSSWSEHSRKWQTGASRLDPLPDAYNPTLGGASKPDNDG